VSALGFGLGVCFDSLSLELFLNLGEISVLLVLGGGSALSNLVGLGLAGLELVNAAGSVDEFLLARVERVAVGADFNANLLHGRMSSEGGVAAVAVNGGLE